MPDLKFGSWAVKEIWIIDLSTASVGKLMSSSKLFLFSNEANLNSGVLPYSLFELYEINNGIHIYMFTFERAYSYLRIWWWFLV